MATEQQALVEALNTLDHKDDAQWTDDGSPRVDVIQKICNDVTVTRAQINAALPGFQRKSKETIDEETQKPEVKTTTMPPALKADADDDLDDLDTNLTDDELKAIAKQRVDDAETALTAAKGEVAEAQRKVGRLEMRHDRALKQFHAKFPPLSQEENIQLHIAAQQRALYERVTGKAAPVAVLNPLDQRMQDRKRDNGRGQAPASNLPKRLTA